MKRSLMIVLIPVLIAIIVVPASLTYAKSKKVTVAATPTFVQLEQKYMDAATSRDKVRILIVPGHEPAFGGAGSRHPLVWMVRF